MAATTKNLLEATAPGASEQGFHPVQGQQQFVGPQNNRISQNLAQAKPMGGEQCTLISLSAVARGLTRFTF
ncbi:hypothetical protein EV702DRAFT_1201286 [Suillus placidus]|uniref:Uncharacterized protein n=1 Tax=Suillus placidus TaxID=48579 RepID=A0A9P6ZNZ3_9AGAM|nr:hypothetical protein EV702DRAFT_1201286 [Suillus placidus]